MKRVLILFLSGVLMAGSSVSHAQIKPVKALVSNDFADSKIVNAASIAPLIKEQQDKVKLFNAYLLKAALHRADPGKYPITNDANSMEQQALKIVNAVSAKRFENRKPGIERLMVATEPKRAKLLGRFSNLDFTRPLLLDAATEQQEGNNLKVLKNVFRPIKQSSTTPDYNSLSFILRALHCVDETDPESPGNDDMVLGATFFQINKDGGKGDGFNCGTFDDDTYRQYGEHPLLTISPTDNVYPKVFYCVLALIEYDGFGSANELAEDINNTLSSLGGKVCDIAGCGLLLNELVGVVEGLIGLLFDDDPFPLYTVSLTLNSKDDFGPGGQSGKLATNPITGHGGKYKVGFRWRIN